MKRQLAYGASIYYLAAVLTYSQIQKVARQHKMNSKLLSLTGSENVVTYAIKMSDGGGPGNRRTQSREERRLLKGIGNSTLSCKDHQGVLSSGRD